MDRQQQIIKQAEQFVQEVHSGDGSGHDWWHIHRVRNTALAIARKEQADVFVCELAALLHDVADEKLNPSKEAGILRVRSWLDEHVSNLSVNQEVMEIISTMSYNGGKNPPMSTLAGQIVQDADRLDAIGAIGIARTFAFGGSRGRSMHEPGQDFSDHDYRSRGKTTIYHFYEKLLKLKDLMNTRHAQKLAESRHEYMLRFLEQFYREWDATDEHQDEQNTTNSGDMSENRIF
ncbi:phosphohydrolase [Paenibacillus sp. J53TS2]|uniref:HD domain-containing protein n=1 Tax=Paenibacillus sp. J53TS2 TaxID=2807197 RepID=UPI001B09CC85|nr:HD domain-containing protein [Paenibacillus sp. J53TS2]GIP46810.1 phosphohydrolase [Paenibacillus sp. J53TS2]